MIMIQCCSLVVSLKSVDCFVSIKYVLQILSTSIWIWFNYRDIALWYMSAFMSFVYRAETPPTLQKLFDETLDHELEGPTPWIKVPNHVSIQTPSPKLSAVDTLKNRHKEAGIILKMLTNQNTNPIAKIN